MKRQKMDGDGMLAVWHDRIEEKEELDRGENKGR
jgi:hypothetical protein